MIYANRFCKGCNEDVKVEKKETISMGMGILLSLITAGIFVPIWILIAIIDWIAPFRCSKCGRVI